MARLVMSVLPGCEMLKGTLHLSVLRQRLVMEVLIVSKVAIKTMKTPMESPKDCFLLREVQVSVLHVCFKYC